MLTPRQTVEALDKYIIGQAEAKRAVAVALRNRYRRSRLSPELRDEITPKNILMMGPTGVGKTEIARRLAKLVDAPFVKVEATKFTEVGYVGRDVESLVRDLVEEAIRLVKNRKMAQIQLSATAAAELRLVELLLPSKKKKSEKPVNPLQLLMGGNAPAETEADTAPEEKELSDDKRRELLERLRRGELENETVELEIQEREPNAMFAIGVDVNLQDVLGDILPKKRKRRKMSVARARRILVQQESERRVNMDEVYQEAIESAEQNGIVFIDEIDKICGAARGHGPDVSREGVQRDILPIVEGSTVTTKYGPVKTDYMLFIAAGAFHVSKVEDLIPELQGRFPIRVKLGDLSEEEFYQILSQPQNAITKQYAALLGADNVCLSFTDGALKRIAAIAYAANEGGENIGARRLHTVMEELLSDLSFHAGGDHPIIDVAIDESYVDEHLAKELANNNIHRYIL